MKISKPSKDRYLKWRETAKKKDKYKLAGVVYTQKELDIVLGITPPKQEPKQSEDINIDIGEEHEDMGHTFVRGDSEEY